MSKDNWTPEEKIEMLEDDRDVLQEENKRLKGEIVDLQNDNKQLEKDYEDLVNEIQSTYSRLKEVFDDLGMVIFEFTGEEPNA